MHGILTETRPGGRTSKILPQRNNGKRKYINGIKKMKVAVKKQEAIIAYGVQGS